MKISVKEEFQSLIPPLSPDEYKHLEENLLSEGCRDAIVIWKGFIIDGHNRYEICNKYSLSYETISMDFETEDNVKSWMIKNQFGRRNLIPFTRAELALRLKPLLALEAKQNQGKRNDLLVGVDVQKKSSESNETRNKLAEMANLSHDSIAKAEYVLNNAPDAILSSARNNEISINQAHIVAKMDVESQEEILEDIANNATPASEAIKKVTLATLNTGDEESYTPVKYLDSARKVLGGVINLDPASNPMAQENVKADKYFTKEDNSLAHEWVADSCWLNPPYPARIINEFLAKLCDHYAKGNIKTAIALTNNNTDTSWFHKTMIHASAVCFTAGRINFLKRDGTKSSPTNGQMFFYFGEDVIGFKEEFEQYGLVMVKL